MENIFKKEITEDVVSRLNRLNPDTAPLWGKMSVAQMIAHCNVAYELVYEEDKHKKPNPVMSFILRTFVKNMVVNKKPYKHNGPTSPAFIIKGDKDFNAERINLISHLRKTQELGDAYFDNKKSHSFGVLSKTEWNNMFYKHLNHHLQQFNV